ncbi:hypothetical protein K8I85_09775, partial [bacterium]|nr:hypothetical protein [bacterium]
PLRDRPGAPGRRPRDGALLHGGELPGGARLSLAVSSYRAQGGGGYASLRSARVVERTGRDLRGLLGDYIRARGTITPELFGNWRVAGARGEEAG